MPRCQFPRCERVVRDPNRFNLCHVHLEMGEFFLWFTEYLQRIERLAGKGVSELRPSGLVLPQR